MANLKVFGEYVKPVPVTVPTVTYPNLVVLPTTSVIDDYTSNNLINLYPLVISNPPVVGSSIKIEAEYVKLTPVTAPPAPTYPSIVILPSSSVIDDYTSNNLVSLMTTNSISISNTPGSTLLVNGIKSVNVSSGTSTGQYWTD